MLNQSIYIKNLKLKIRTNNETNPPRKLHKKRKEKKKTQNVPRRQKKKNLPFILTENFTFSEEKVCRRSETSLFCASRLPRTTIGSFVVVEEIISRGRGKGGGLWVWEADGWTGKRMEHHTGRKDICTFCMENFETVRAWTEGFVDHRLDILLLLRLTPLRLLCPSFRDPLQDVVSVLVPLQLGDLNLAGMDPQRDGLPVGFFAHDPLDMDDIFEAVDGGDFATAALVGAADDGDFVVFADGD